MWPSVTALVARFALHPKQRKGTARARGRFLYDTTAQQPRLDADADHHP